ncbi:MAG: helix-turn-helix transcriptional regulator [bacterium]|nr:helix-turn-helix transcriptional regulator [bacterium]
MERYGQRAGEQMTYERLATATGLSRATLEAIGSRPEYNPTLATIERLCVALECDPGELLELERPRKTVVPGSA